MLRPSEASRRGSYSVDMTNICDDRKLSDRFVKSFENLRNWSSDQFFVDLGQLAATSNSTIADHSFEAHPESRGSDGRLEEHDRSADARQPVEPLCSVF